MERPRRRIAESSSDNGNCKSSTVCGAPPRMMEEPCIDVVGEEGEVEEGEGDGENLP